MSGKTYAEISAPTFALATGLIVGATILTTHALCVHSGVCPALPKLPTISNTWDNPPGNYLSRFVIGNAALAMAMMQGIMFFNDSTKEVGSPKCQKFILISGLVGCFCLSWVGAICDDDTNPQCRGNNTIHSIFAVTFFVLYDMMIVIVACQQAKKKGGKASKVSLALAALTLLTKVRWLPGIQGYAAEAGAAVGTSVGQTTGFLAYFEYADVFFIMTWTCHYVYIKGKPYTVAIHERTITPANGDGGGGGADPALFRLSAMTLANVVLAEFIGTLAICLAFYFAQHRAPAGSWPFISDTFVYPPGDWISRWAVVDAAALGTLVHVSIMYVEEGTLCCAKIIYTTAIVAIFGVAVVGCVNEQENLTVHMIGAGVFFAGYDLFMVLRTIAHFLPSCTAATAAASRRRPPSKGARLVLAFIAMASTACTIARFCPHARAMAGRYVSDESVLLPVLEWIDACTICAYMYVSVCLLGDRAKNCGLSLLYTAPAPASAGTTAATALLSVPLMHDDDDDEYDVQEEGAAGIVLVDGSTLTYL